MGMTVRGILVAALLLLPGVIRAEDTGPRHTVEQFLALAQGYNLRQRAVRDAWLPLFLSSDDCDRQVVQMARRMQEKRFAEGRVRRSRIRSIEIDEAYGHATAHIEIIGQTDWWLPARAGFDLILKLVDGRWLIKGPELLNIDQKH